jgi:trehalose-phosphatase
MILEHWLSLARHTPLAILSDLNGTLIPFAPTPDEAQPDPELLSLLRALGALPGLRVVLVSGRPHGALERYFPDRNVWLVGEHGAWLRGEGAWQPAIDLDPRPMEGLAQRMETLAKAHPGARLERKTWSCAIHDRQVPRQARAALAVEASAAIDEFVAAYPSFERLDGDHVVEVHPAAVRKSLAVPWVRQKVGADTRLIALGGDLTDEHMFAALEPRDEAVLVRGGVPRRTAARWEVDGVAGARALLAFVHDIRSGTGAPPRASPASPIGAPAKNAPSPTTLLVVSNRLPDLRSSDAGDSLRRRNVGGLVSALEPILTARHGLWLGWGGRVVPDSDEPTHGVDDEGSPPLAWFDYKQSWHRDYYN